MNYEEIIQKDTELIKAALTNIYLKTGLIPDLQGWYDSSNEKAYIGVRLSTFIQGKRISEETVIADTAIKSSEAVKMSDDGTVEGYLVRFTDANSTDLDGEYFTAKTFLGDSNKLTLMYDHGTNDYIKKLPIGVVELTRDEKGIYAKGKLDTKAIKDFYSEELDKAKKYIENIYKLGREGLLGWSSGAPVHTVEKTKSGEIKSWILAEASLTPTPAEPRNIATIKSGREFSDKNKTRFKNMYEKAKELYTELESLNKEFEETSSEPSTRSKSQQIQFYELLSEKSNGQ